MRLTRGSWWLGGTLLVASLSIWILMDRRPRDSTPPSFTSLAVLPFDSSSSDTQHPDLATGLSFDLLRRLQIVAALQCVPRSQVLAWYDIGRDPNLLARRLGAEILVRGEVHLSSGQIRLHLEVVDARDQTVLSQMDLTESRERVLDLMRRTATAVVDTLKIPIQRHERGRFNRDPTRSLKSWDYFAQGQEYLEDLGNPRGTSFAADLFRRAIEHDPDFAQAQVGLSEALWLDHILSEKPRGLNRAELEIRGVLNRHPQMSSAAVTLAKVLLTAARAEAMQTLPPPEISALAKPDEAMRDVASGMHQVGRLELAETAWRTAEDIGDGLWLNPYGLAQFLRHGGRYGEAAQAFARATETGPPEIIWPQENLIKLLLATGDLQGATEIFIALDSGLVGVATAKLVAAAYAILGRYAEAEQLFRSTLDFDPFDPRVRRELGDLLQRRNEGLHAQEQYQEGLRIARQNLDASPDDRDLQLLLAVLAAKAQDCALALPVAISTQHKIARSAEDSLDLAMVFSLCDQPAKAIEELRTALTQGLAPELVTSRPELLELTSTPELQAILSAGERRPPSP